MKYDKNVSNMLLSSFPDTKILIDLCHLFCTFFNEFVSYLSWFLFYGPVDVFCLMACSKIFRSVF